MKSTGTLTVRIEPELERLLTAEARRRRTSRNELVRELLAAALTGRGDRAALEAEARRQSLLARRRGSEGGALDFTAHAADDRGWEEIG